MQRVIRVNLESRVQELEWQLPKVVVTPLPDYVARISKDASKVYIDPSAPKKIYHALQFHDLCQWILVFLFKLDPKEVETHPTHDVMERGLVELEGMSWEEYQAIIKKCMGVVKAREPKPEAPSDTIGPY